MLDQIPEERRISNGPSLNAIEAGEKVVPLVGIELTTFRLQGGCSTN